MTREKTEAEKEAEREAKRNAIRAQIAAVNSKIAQATGLMNQFRECRSSIGHKLNDWRTSHSIYRAKPVVFEIKIADTFQGDIAEDLSLGVPNAVEIMNKTESSMNYVQNAIQVQISKIQDYISQLKAERSALESELASI